MGDIITAKDLYLWYGPAQALNHIHIAIPENNITTLTGPSGCSKSTFLKTLNRMNGLAPGVKITGEVRYGVQDIFAPRAGCECPAPGNRHGVPEAQTLPYVHLGNVAYGPRTHGMSSRAKLDELVERPL